MKDDLNFRCFVRCVSDLLTTEQVQKMRQWRHHFDVTCYDHSIFVSYVAFRLARRWRLDYTAAARAGLLHDLYLYDPHDKTAHPGNQCLDHPRFALRNAKSLVELTPVEENCIISHMWPLSPRMPKCKLAVVVNLADKICATLEVSHIYNVMQVRRVMNFA
ncbi:MAG: HD domain-containing protein [Oscillospiraceae bacterium]